MNTDSHGSVYICVAAKAAFICVYPCRLEGGGQDVCHRIGV